ncbi:MAG: hypothetical protein F6K31_34060, partial [Symploca sp. SIO2G7]|nr:hypothetical protein [Symploca sp. SIO2G7]
MSERDYIPLMFQAQIMGRSQIQKLEYLKKTGKPRQQAYDWVEQWQKACNIKHIPTFNKPIATQEYTFTWRMVTNSGQDGGVIRPVIGKRGWPYFPGSSMKGAFRRACTSVAEKLRYCGGTKDDELHPGILRFHGGYPKNAEWLDSSLVDVVHPQENWQFKDQSRHSALIQISLYQPTFVFGISCTELLAGDPEWTRIWEIWQTALERGIGSRVSAGYGQIKTHKTNRLLAIGLQGQGLTSKLINEVGEFRPNIFKAALRSHTRRLFNGITDAETAERLTKQFWGGFQGKKAIVGLLGIAFTAPDLDDEEIYIYRDQINTREMPVYETGDSWLNLLIMRKISEGDRKNLRIWAIQLVKFAMLLGGFGKSWRRVDHRLFSHATEFRGYLTNWQQQNINPMIGCHWQFTESSKPLYVRVENLADITKFLDHLQKNTKKLIEKKYLNFLKQSNYPINPPTDHIREAWRKSNVEVWGRIAKSATDCHAIAWFHRAYQGEKSIKASEL